jgi:hypothetical protein
MKLLTIGCVLICCVPALASARPKNQAVAPGQPTIVARYYTWNSDCSARVGVATALSKPEHGTISKQFVSWQIGASRRKGGAVDQCFGKPIEALAVVYKSQPGFHGIDHFVFDVNYAGYRETDTFTISVQ